MEDLYQVLVAGLFGIARLGHIQATSRAGASAGTDAGVGAGTGVGAGNGDADALLSAVMDEVCLSPTRTHRRTNAARLGACARTPPNCHRRQPHALALSGAIVLKDGANPPRGCSNGCTWGGAWPYHY